MGDGKSFPGHPAGGHVGICRLEAPAPWGKRPSKGQGSASCHGTEVKGDPRRGQGGCAPASPQGPDGPPRGREQGGTEGSIQGESSKGGGDGSGVRVLGRTAGAGPPPHRPPTRAAQALPWRRSDGEDAGLRPGHTAALPRERDPHPGRTPPPFIRTGRIGNERNRNPGGQSSKNLSPTPGPNSLLACLLRHLLVPSSQDNVTTSFF